MKTLIKLLLMGLLLFGCADTNSVSPDTTAFEIRSVMMYEMTDQDCTWDAVSMFKGPHDILRLCDHELPELPQPELWSYDHPVLLLGDVWVTDEDGNTLYFNVEVYDPDNNLMAADSHYNLRLWFNGLTNFSAGFLFELVNDAAKGEYTANIWLEDNAGRTTDVFTVSIWYI